ncbi:MAG: hypothetical protein M3297_05180 [Thermoproteota archaeon]|nr:hypothetical protein [Thermoproteota archaeon]
MIESNSPSRDPSRLTGKKLFLNSTVLALIISLPAIVVTLILHYVIKTDLIVTLSASLIVLFIAMGFGVKISKKLSKY